MVMKCPPGWPSLETICDRRCPFSRKPVMRVPSRDVSRKENVKKCAIGVPFILKSEEASYRMPFRWREYDEVPFGLPFKWKSVIV